ncbi:MAG: hypothetical protein HY265_07065 [Deltaproteobacteria bacterium]|nr:hypothetical protein [Deltaproteobacteria bacterium]MBI3755902.1 hypothetical protein [Deltaproteobacteria bacterium]
MDGYSGISKLHAVRSNAIYWVNYGDTAKSILIKAGETVKITRVEGYIIKFELTRKAYNSAFTEKGNTGSDELYSKFFTTENINADNLTLKEILASDNWIYYYNKFNR